ncbi:tryptophan 7-halogenase [Novosphingobium umbonatum]|uniref:Tryptophan 7-halogenase n=1 Tax=Novosphingobium umbonatum TaxID=1908524 RepID=A0A437NC78_9SPHN|nr:tryptophan halogenase family protein [Novosphingobium umbonatum]RVU07545.1 tryptophan 7-halogenase [Novosphingobium umbonatum]
MEERVKSVVVVGGGTAGWMAAALIAKVIGKGARVELVESDAIGIIGVGEATIPPIQTLNSVLGIDEATFLRETKATVKLAIRFENWGQQGESYYHTFGAAGRNMAFCSFHHFWTRARQRGHETSYWDYDLNYLCCEAGQFAPTTGNDPIWDMPYAYHFDSALYGQFLRRLSEQMGVRRTEGMIGEVRRCATTGDVTSVVLQDGREIAGDLFIDCSGQRGLLIQQALRTGYEDWDHWLPCDRAMAVPSEPFATTAPYTRSIAHGAGWQWRIPLQHRNGNGLVYSSRHYSDDQAAQLLLGNLDSKALDEPRVIPFRTGRARQQWNRNVVAVGLSSGFLEPLESTSIYLIQSAIVRLLHLFPHGPDVAALRAEYNRQSAREYELIRDFIILHYHANRRDDSAFWRDLREMAVPDRLAQKIELFRASGALVQDQLDIFMEASWVQVLMGQGILLQDYHPLANGPSDAELRQQLSQLRQVKAQPLSQLPAHDAWLAAKMGAHA